MIERTVADPNTVVEFASDFLASANRIKMRTDPAYAFWAITGQQPYDYQADYLRDNHRMNVVVKSRQTGFTMVAAFKKFWLAWTGKGSSDSEIIISVSKRASDTVMRYIKGYFRGVNIDEKTAEVWNADQITLDNGISIFSLPQAPSSIRSLHGNVLMDEAAFYERSKEIKEAVLPFMSRGYNLDVISTPRGMDDFFFQSFWQNPEFHKWEVPWHACPDLTEENLRPIWAAMDEESIQQEYHCQFVDEATAYFPYSLIMGCVDSDLDWGDTTTKRLHSTGVDIGRVKDATEVIGFDVNAAVRLMKTMKNVKFNEQKAFLRSVIPHSGVTAIDRTGIGMMLAEEMEEEFGHIVQGQWFTQDSKEAWATFTRVMMEKGVDYDGRRLKLRIPNDRDLINQIHSMKRKPTATGIRFDVEKNDKHHGDKFWALALGLYAGFAPATDRMGVLDNEQLNQALEGGRMDDDNSDVNEWADNLRAQRKAKAKRIAQREKEFGVRNADKERKEEVSSDFAEW